MFKKAMIYLGMASDEHYESFDNQISQPTSHPMSAGRYPSRSPQEGIVVPGQAPPASELGRTVWPVNSGGDDESPRGARSTAAVPDATVHRIETKRREPHAVSPQRFNDAQEIGDRFRSGQPVIVNLELVDASLRRRLVDFASGLCYAMSGKMDRVSEQVYLLTPSEQSPRSQAHWPSS